MRFHDLSDALAHADQCFQLELNDAGLQELPAGSLTKLTKLEELHLSGNPGLDWDALFGMLAGLQGLLKLTLMDCQLERLPPSIGDLKALQYLHVDNNQLSALPEETSQLAELTNFSADNNQLSALPAGFFGLGELKFLSLRENQFEDFPAEVNKLGKLVTFHLEGNPLSKEAIAGISANLPGSVFVFRA